MSSDPELEPHASGVAPEDFLLRLPEVLKRVPISKASWYRLIQRGEAPKPVHLGNMSVWRASEISAWIASLKA